MEGAKNGLTETKKKLFEAKKENTKIISRITNFGELQMKLNKKLDSTNKQLFVIENYIFKNHFIISIRKRKMMTKEMIWIEKKRI